MIVAVIALLVVGVVIGILGMVAFTEAWAASDDGRRRLALVRAENRVRDAQTAALNRLADVAASAVYDQTSDGPTTWPSEREDDVIDGELVHTPEQP